MSTVAFARALTHQTRADILVDLDTSGSLTPGRFAAAHNLRVENVAYHFRMLRDHGLIRLVKLIPVRGTVEHEYVLTDPGRRALAFARALLVEAGA